MPSNNPPKVTIGETLRQVRRQRILSQGDIENRTGMLRCYVSRIENGHTDPSLDTLKRFAGAFGIPRWCVIKAWEEPETTSEASR